MKDLFTKKKIPNWVVFIFLLIVGAILGPEKGSNIFIIGMVSFIWFNMDIK